MSATERMRRWRAENHEHYLAYQRDLKRRMRLADPEGVRAKDRERYARDGERIRARLATYRASRAAFIAELKNRPCADCGQQFHHAAMQFDHLPERGPKRMGIAREGVKRALPVLLEELERCEVVCANCHAVRTYQRAKETRA